MKDFPNMGRILPEFPDLQYKEIIIGNLRVIYKFFEKLDSIIILAVVHGNRMLNGDFLK